jgi:hypothetical protein
MSGGGGGHIIIDSVKQTLTNPIVSGQLPAKMQTQITPILAKDDADWTAGDKSVVGRVFVWALTNCQ